MQNEDMLILAEMPYQAVQGEGRFVGEVHKFVRLQGCDVGCSWCDSYYTWVPFNEERVSKEIMVKVAALNLKHEAVMERVNNCGRSKILWITGGEPLLQSKSLHRFVDLARRYGYTIHICTSGKPLDEELIKKMDYVTLDVKLPTSGVRSHMNVVERLIEIIPTKLELKAVVGNALVDRDTAETLVRDIPTYIPITLQPLYVSEPEIVGRNVNPDALKGWLSYVEFADWFVGKFAHISNVRLGLQLHKVLYPTRSRGI